MPPLVSVVMPCRNAGNMLRPALQSVLTQSHPSIEIIFVDNNSTDDSVAVAREVLEAGNRAFVITTCTAPGANHARNYGYGRARGDYIQWLDADDCLAPGKLALQVAALEADPTDDIAYGDWSVHRIAAGKPDDVKHTILAQEPDQLRRTFAGIWYPPHLYLLRRAAAGQLQTAQAWWPTRLVATDVEYSAMAALLGLHFRYVAGAHVRYNIWSDTQLTSATPYATRVAALRAIFRRLQDQAATGGARVALSDAQQALLHQDWTTARLPRDAVTFLRLANGRFALRRRADGARIMLDRREAMIARWLMFTGYEAVPMHQALAIATDIPEFADAHVEIIAAIDRLREAGFLQAA